jgi:predicted small lipoprotein YifL
MGYGTESAVFRRAPAGRLRARRNFVKEDSMKSVKTVAVQLMAALLLIAGLSACEKEGPLERAGEKVDRSLERAGDKAERATNR